jgi:hypothetical protein
MGDAMWVGPAVMGLVFGIAFGFLFPIMSRWMASADAQPRRGLAGQFVTGLLSGVLFGALVYMGKLIDAGSLAGGWVWFDRGVKIFGAVCALAGLWMIAMRLIRGRG